MHKRFFYGAFILLLAGLAVACTESFEDRCRREAKEYTERMCPRVMAEYIIMDSMVYNDNPIGFTYYYNISGKLDDRELLTPDVLEEFRSELLKNLRQDINLKKYKDRNFTFTYKYVSASTRETFTEVSYGPEDYN
ncbi:MAG: hypothetical protein K6A32_05210 [Bacteroidales bacterium]|nr:hypothetical protein [Bacteroidales bacterium]